MQTEYGAGRPKWGKQPAVQTPSGAGRPKLGEAASWSNRIWGWRAKVGEAASCANGIWGWRAKVEIHQEVEVHSKVFVVASKCVSGNDFWLSFILSVQIFPSNKTILKMNK